MVLSIDTNLIIIIINIIIKVSISKCWCQYGKVNLPRDTKNITLTYREASHCNTVSVLYFTLFQTLISNN